MGEGAIRDLAHLVVNVLDSLHLHLLVHLGSWSSYHAMHCLCSASKSILARRGLDCLGRFWSMLALPVDRCRLAILELLFLLRRPIPKSTGRAESSSASGGRVELL